MKPIIPKPGYCHTCHRTAEQRAQWHDPHCYASDCPARKAGPANTPDFNNKKEVA